MTTKDLARLQDARDLALQDTTVICGIVCRHLSLRTYTLLKRLRNKFIIGGAHPGPDDVAMYLWVVSPDYSTNTKAHARFIKELRPWLKPTSWPANVVAIGAYLAETHIDAPEGKDDSPVALIDLLAREYGWSDAAILDMPIARAFQFRREILMRLMREATS